MQMLVKWILLKTELNLYLVGQSNHRTQEPIFNERLHELIFNLNYSD